MAIATQKNRKKPSPLLRNIASPKRANSTVRASAAWYDFYAMYAAEFVQGILDRTHQEKNSVVLDPWNGTGTTTTIAGQNGFETIGIDISPAMTIIAKGRTARTTDSLKLSKFLEKLNEFPMPVRTLNRHDPLLTWFKPNAVKVIRNLQKIIHVETGGTDEIQSNQWASMSHITCLAYTALFRTIREVLAPLRGSNPTWIRTPKVAKQKLTLSATKARSLFKKHSEFLIALLATSQKEALHKQPALKVGDSTALPINSNSVDIVITSPPYCTRIDYAQSTAPELAILHYGPKELRKLREAMLGTPVIFSAGQKLSSEKMGKLAEKILEKIRTHASKSGSYYYKNYLQYFQKLALSLAEISRVSKSRATAIFVLQDSFYKTLHVDLPQIVTQMQQQHGWELKEWAQFETKTMAAINPHRIKYRTNISAHETVLLFTRG